MADVLKSIMNKITDDDPATRGQQLWVMFTLAIFLAAVLNYYAMVREPDIIEMKDLIEYKNEGYDMFLEMMTNMRRNVLYSMFMFQPAGSPSEAKA